MYDDHSPILTISFSIIVAGIPVLEVVRRLEEEKLISKVRTNWRCLYDIITHMTHIDFKG
jgi:hypothetical protein